MRVRGLGRARVALCRLTERGEQRSIVLLYHRVAEPPVDPLLLSVAPERFAAHLQVLRRLAEPIPLHDVKTAARPAVAVTFDDGYADNFDVAGPLLRAAGVPATVFVATGRLGRPSGFWWDELAALLLQPGEFPASLDVPVGERRVRMELGAYSEDDYARWSGWSVAAAADPGPRQAAFRRLFDAARPLADAARTTLVEAIRDAAPSASAGWAPVAGAEAVAAAARVGIEIGAHTETHPILAGLDEDAQHAELAASKRRLEEITGGLVTSAAYPFGGDADVDAASFRAARGVGFDRACINRPGVVRDATDPLRLPRLLVRDWSADEFEGRLVQWLGDRFF